MSLEQFRTDVRTWLNDNCPASMRTPAPDSEVVWGGRRETFKNPDSKAWLKAMASRGWTAPTWPKAYGGGGLSPEENRVLQAELSAINARPALSSFGLWMLGPVLLETGTEAQRQRFLPDIVHGRIRWCQGYSEPGAGSDLASLQTRAEDNGDHYLVNGSKIWTSYANFADWIFCLVRTDPTAPKHEGISFLLFDMSTEGVTTSPIRLISGASPFCQTFFDNVKVPKENLVGDLNAGWTIAKRLLQHERAMIATIGKRSGGAEVPLENVAKQYVGEVDGQIADPILRDDIARHRMNDHAFALTTQRAAAEAKAGMAAGAASSMFKYYGTEQNKRKFELLLDCMGGQGLGWEGEQFEASELQATRSWLRSKANSIEGGTTEVQLNIISKRVLELPETK
ncbi:MAG: acyl-CoA dehydrogenase family protein [Gammaproteobacteria bacterium]|nr:acyl-CoA dehydrogenase family protein [Gammaproteobacteria bacterium]